MAEKKDKVNSKKKSEKKQKKVNSKKDKVKNTEEIVEEQEVEVKQENVDEKQDETKEEVDFEKKFNELNDKYVRLSAEFDNFRRRSLKEKMELIKSAGEDILLNILPVMDNFERALKSMDGNGEVEIGAVKEGVELIYNNFKEFLAQKGVKEIEAVGKEFDTDHHEAISKIPAPEDDLKGKVIDVIEKGYVMHEKVIRFAKVVVGE
jgi:molecular chaperone GrpE